VINLGTNDYSTQPAPPQVFEEGFAITPIQHLLQLTCHDTRHDQWHDTGSQKFVGKIHRQCKGNHETPHFFLACGPMISQPCCSYVKNVVDKEKAMGVNIIGSSTSLNPSSRPPWAGNATLLLKQVY
jgi:hypothetical protein